MQQSQRLISLDAFRGLTVVLMILVNNPGDWGHVYATLLHADWHGCTPTDLVFPFFLFIVGVSVVFSIDKNTKNKAEMVEKIVLRGLKLFCLGLFLNFYSKIDFHIDFVPLVLQRIIISLIFIALMFGNWERKITWSIVIGFILLCLMLMIFQIGDFGTMRIPGVLQRIGIVYAIISLLYIFTSLRTQIICFALILIGYWLLMAFVPVPNGNAANFDKAINLASWLDSIILKNHVWVQTKTWDPEGILSTIPAIATGLAGIFAGFWIRLNNKNPKQLIIGLLSAGFVAIIWGLVWNEVFPINKALWTSSYVFYAGGLAAICLAVFYLLIDVWGFKAMFMPLVFFGVNAMTVFFGSGLIPRVLSGVLFLDDAKETNLKAWIYEHGIIPCFEDPINASLTGALVFLLIWFFILWAMYKNKIFVKV